LTRGRRTTDEILEELLSNEEPERPLRGHELLSMLGLGQIEPGNYEVETTLSDGSVETEKFRVDEDGEVRDMEVSVRPAARGEKRKDSGERKEG
jgi:hypothetical protein